MQQRLIIKQTAQARAHGGAVPVLWGQLLLGMAVLLAAVLLYAGPAQANPVLPPGNANAVEVVLAENPTTLQGRPTYSLPYIVHAGPSENVATTTNLGPASTTKILSAYAMLEWLANQGSNLNTVGNTALRVNSAAEIVGNGEDSSTCYRNYSRCTAIGNCPIGAGSYTPFAALSFSLVRSHNDMASFTAIKGAARGGAGNFGTYQQWQAQKIQQWASQTEFQALENFTGKGEQLPEGLRNQRVFAGPTPNMGVSPSGCSANSITVYNLARLTQMFVRSFILSTRHSSFPSTQAVTDIVAARSIATADPISGQPNRARETITGHTASALFNKLAGSPAQVVFSKTGTAQNRRVLTSAISFPSCGNQIFYITVNAPENSGRYRFNRTLELLNYISQKYLPQTCHTNFTPLTDGDTQCQMRSGMNEDERRVAMELCQRGQELGEYFDVDVRDLPPGQVPDFSLARPSPLPVDLGGTPLGVGGEGSQLCDDDIRQNMRNAAMAALQAELERADMFYQPMASAIQAAQCIEPLRQLYRQFADTIDKAVGIASAVATGDMTVVGAATAGVIEVVRQIVRVLINAIVAQLSQQVCNATNAAINGLDSEIRRLTCIGGNDSLFPTWEPINLGLNNSPKQCGGWSLNFSEFAQGGNLVQGPGLINGMPNVGFNINRGTLGAVGSRPVQDLMNQAPPPRFETYSRQPAGRPPAPVPPDGWGP